jgi:hypothetical protein
MPVERVIVMIVFENNRVRMVPGRIDEMFR